MKKILIAITLCLLMISLLAIPTLAKAPTLHKATGGGTVNLPDGRIVTTAITAIQVDENGNAKGQMEFVTRDTGAKMHVEVLYLAVDGNNAWIGGVITSGQPAGWGVVGRVQDNGEGSKATGPDKRSLFYYGSSISPDEALSMIPYEIFDWTNGNVQVK